MTQDSVKCKDYTPAPTGHRVEIAGVIHLPVASYELLSVQVDQRINTLKGPTRELTLVRVARVPDLERPDLHSMTRRAQSFDTLMQFHTAAAVICPHIGVRPLTFRYLPPENMMERPAIATSLLVARRIPQNIIEFHAQTALVTGEQLNGS